MGLNISSNKITSEWFTPEEHEDEPEEERLAFKIRPLNESEKMDCQRVYTDDQGRQQVDPIKMAKAAYSIACSDARNLTIDNRTPKRFGRVKRDVPMELQIEIGNRIWEISDVTEDEEKN